MDAITRPDPTGTHADDGVDAAFRARARTAAEKFEGFFIAESLKQMRRGNRELAGDDALFKDRLNDDMLEMADGMVADALAGQHAFGVADMLLRQLLPPAPPHAPAASAAPALNETAAPVASDKS